jgi:3-hydroxy-9,10-secoandrosta-1,3,5(10)-triene-9,17-dione monooxygenase
MSQLIERARSFVPALAERRGRAAELRRIPDETIAEMTQAGFFRLLQPRGWGGLEVPPNTFFEVQRTLATGCASTAWVMGVLAVHAWQLALFEKRAQREVWEADPNARIASSYAPTGTVRKVDGGYHLSGRWSFSSGCDHSSWIFLGGHIPADADHPTPQMRTFLLPREDWRIEDTWHVVGLEATGSKDIIVESAFVPSHRTHKFSDGFTCRSPGLAVHQASLYRLPFGQLFVRSVSTTAIGVLEAALDAYVGVARDKIAASNKGRVALDPVSQMVCAEARATLDEVVLVLHRSFDEMLAFIDANEPIPIERRVQFRYESARAVDKCTRAVEALFTASGGRALFRGAQMQRCFQDAHAVRAHFANKPEGPGRNLGGVLLGVPSTDLFL